MQPIIVMPMSDLETSKSLEWIKQRSHESYAKNYSMIFLHDEPLAGRNMKKDVLFKDLTAAGCVYQVRHFESFLTILLGIATIRARRGGSVGRAAAFVESCTALTCILCV